MVADGRYVANSEAYLETAYAALAARFPDREAFNTFYTALPNDTKRDEFLRVASFYRYLVKNGDWCVNADDSEPVVDYLTNSFKLISLFSLIESLKDKIHIEFHDWLCQKNTVTIYPIPDTTSLKQLHKEYKESYGSIRHCVAFFQGLPPERQKELCSAINIKGKTLCSIDEVAKFLYGLRCKFVHEAVLVLQVSSSIVISRKNRNATVKTKLPLNGLLDAFEEGLVAWFRQAK
jgi:hypothetical protein